MAYTNLEGRQQLLDELGSATEAIGMAIAMLGEAYELLDDQTADRLEELLFRPAQAASARAKRTYGEFAERHRFPPRSFDVGRRWPRQGRSRPHRPCGRGDPAC